MKLILFTIVLDGMPWIPMHLPTFNRLRGDWEWHIVEGVASPTHCTSWCKQIAPRLSTDGTSEYLDSIASHPRVRIHRKPSWDGKIEMVNVPMGHVSEPSVVMQVDVDEVWQSDQIEVIRSLFDVKSARNAAMFRCRYFVGPNLILTGKNCYGNHESYEWIRAWKINPGQRFELHEPPKIHGAEFRPVRHQETIDLGLVFDHYAYATRRQVEFKERFYGYAGAVAAWDRLQANRNWPAKLRDFLPWVTDDAIVQPLFT